MAVEREKMKRHADAMVEREKHNFDLEKLKIKSEDTLFVCALKARMSLFCKRYYYERLLEDARPLLVQLGLVDKKTALGMRKTKLSHVVREQWQKIKDDLQLDVVLPAIPEEVSFGTLSDHIHNVPPLRAIFVVSDESEVSKRFWKALARKYTAVFEELDADR